MSFMNVVGYGYDYDYNYNYNYNSDSDYLLKWGATLSIEKNAPYYVEEVKRHKCDVEPVLATEFFHV